MAARIPDREPSAVIVLRDSGTIWESSRATGLYTYPIVRPSGDQRGVDHSCTEPQHHLRLIALEFKRHDRYLAVD